MPNKAPKERIKLSPYFVAYMDILGAKKFINSENSEDYLNKIYQLYNETISILKANNQNIYRLNTKTKIFSDNIIISIPYEEYFGDTTNSINSLYIMIFVSFFQIIALKHSLLVRGSIVIDDFYIDENFVYGKALTQAYKLEDEIANYPRIIINPKNISKFNKSDTQQRILMKDNSNLYYINPFECYFDWITEIEKKEVLNFISKTLKSMLNKNNDEKINQKVCWFINMFNDFCNKHIYNQYVINLYKYPYDPDEIPVIYTGGRRKFENAK